SSSCQQTCGESAAEPRESHALNPIGLIQFQSADGRQFTPRTAIVLPLLLFDWPKLSAKRMLTPMGGTKSNSNSAGTSDDAPYLPAGDGLLARKSREWAKRKHHYLRNYCGITTVSMRNRFKLVYL